MRTARLLGHGLRGVAGALVGGGLAAVLVLATPATAPRSAQPLNVAATLQGRAVIKDGDTLVVAGTIVRLEGIDAPELEQSCRTSDGGSWPCGHEATRALADLIGAAAVACTNRGRDRYGRVLGVCSANGQDLNTQMVQLGWAWAFVRYSRAYVDVEARAKTDRVGVWQGDSQTPWDYRASRTTKKPSKRGRALPTAVANASCTIKGNVGASGLIYHTPSSRWYEAIRMDTGQGKRWFCSEPEAVAAGWRAARLH
jgi:endonuclease YncB( thermonuclease family)